MFSPVCLRLFYKGYCQSRWLVFFWKTIVVFRDSYMSTVIFAPKTAPKTAPKNIELHLKFMNQNNRLQNMRSNLSSPTTNSFVSNI